MKHHSRVYSHIFRTCSIPGIFRTLKYPKGMCNLFIRFFIFIFIISVCNYLCRLFRKSRSNLFNRQWSRLAGSSRKCTSRNVERNGNFFVRSIFSNSFSASYFVFKVTSLCFLSVVILNKIHKKFYFMH